MTLLADQSTVIAGAGKNLIFFDLRVMDPVGIYSHSSEIVSLHSSENELNRVRDLVVGDSEGTVTLFDIGKMNEKEIGPFRHGSAVTALFASSTSFFEKSIISGGNDNTLAFWSLFSSPPLAQEGPITLSPLFV